MRLSCLQYEVPSASICVIDTSWTAIISDFNSLGTDPLSHRHVGKDPGKIVNATQSNKKSSDVPRDKTMLGHGPTFVTDRATQPKKAVG